jgi:hypothetical protein
VRYYFIFLIFILFVTKHVVAQKKYVLPVATFSYKTIIQAKPMQPSVKPNFSLYSIAPNFYCSNLAFFCRQEIKLEKALKIPFKFRLGSVQMVDYLEQKPNSTFLR